MITDLRDLLQRVAAGELSPEEGQRLLDETTPAAPTLVPADGPAVARVAVRGTGVRLTVVADPTVATAVADGPHRVERDGDRLVIRSGSDGDGYQTTSGPASVMSWINSGLRGGTRLQVRVNPDLPLEIAVVAGSLTVSGPQAPLVVSVEAGAAKLTGGRGPLRMTTMTGSADVSWQFTGESSIGVELGSAAIRVAAGSDAVVSADGSLSSIALRAPDGTTYGTQTGSAIPAVTAGAGTGALAVAVRLGSAEVTVA